MPKDMNNNLGNVLVYPEDLAERLAQINEGHDKSEAQRIERHIAHRLRLGAAITYINPEGLHVMEDHNGPRPFPVESELPAGPESAELEIRELAFKHHVHGDRTELDDWCEAVSANAGDEIQSDEVELLIIGLRRSEAVDGVELTKLHARYLEEVMAL